MKPSSPESAQHHEWSQCASGESLDRLQRSRCWRHPVVCNVVSTLSANQISHYCLLQDLRGEYTLPTVTHLILKFTVLMDFSVKYWFLFLLLSRDVSRYYIAWGQRLLGGGGICLMSRQELETERLETFFSPCLSSVWIIGSSLIRDPLSLSHGPNVGVNHQSSTSLTHNNHVAWCSHGHGWPDVYTDRGRE